MITFCRHCHREIVGQVGKDLVFRWSHTATGAGLCSGTFAEPTTADTFDPKTGAAA